MSVAVVVGAQWGDEGKGKVVDLLSEQASVVVRYAGGANAGHTLVKDGVKLVTHLIPSGVLHPGTRCILGDGMVVDPEVLLEEIAACQQRGLLAQGELLVGEGAHVVMPYHRVIEELREARAHKIGTTRRGIGPCYESKAARRGIRLGDLLVPEIVRAKIEQNLEELAALIAHYGGEVPGEEQAREWSDAALRAGESLSQYLGNAGRVVQDAIAGGDNVLFEGAQGALLDVDHGTYPYVTSSTTLAGGACAGVGVGPTCIDRVVGITKAYCTRVGEGPFPTEMDEAEAEAWRQAGGEFGATTGRPRRCGWLDLAALRQVARTNGLASLALTKLDVLGGRDRIRVCVGYKVDGQTVDELPRQLDAAEPVYEDFPGWSEDISSARSLDELPGAARDYMTALEGMVGVPFSLVSVGPERDQTIVLREIF
jgi:adenylosuccinate synthase